MIFPLKERVLIRGCAAHKAAGLGCGADYKADKAPLFSPVAGVVKKQYYGSDGGNWLWIQDTEGRMWEFAHLSGYSCYVGQSVAPGELVATTGNTGKITTGPHLHIQIIASGHNGDPLSTRIDPEPLLANIPLPMSSLDLSQIGPEGTLVRIGSSPLRYGYILRGKRFEFTPNNDILMVLYGFEKFKLIPLMKISPEDWDTIPKSDGVKF